MPKLFKQPARVKKNSAFHRLLQKRVANILFPVGQGDWYKQKGYAEKKQQDGRVYETAFDAFVATQREAGALYHDTFKQLELSLAMLPTTLANGQSAALEVFKCQPSAEQAAGRPGLGKHIVYFPGANTYYQACFRDIATAAKETGATVHAFNFPGTGASTGSVREARDLVNAGMAVVNDLLSKGVHPDNIILQGDCYGAAIACRVKQECLSQSGIHVRLIMNNAFKSFKAVIFNLLDGLPNIFKTPLKKLVKALLKFTGWHVTPGKEYMQSGPYQCHVQHLGDQTLISSTLSDKAQKYRHEMNSGETRSLKRVAKVDLCPEEYREARDRLENKHMVRIKDEARERLTKKFGVNKHGQPNAHFADLCELEMLNGESVYTGFVNDYLTASNAYIEAHPQQFDLEKVQLPRFLGEAHVQDIHAEVANDMNGLAACLENSAAAAADQNEAIAVKEQRSEGP